MAEGSRTILVVLPVADLFDSGEVNEIADRLRRNRIDKAQKAVSRLALARRELLFAEKQAAVARREKQDAEAELRGTLEKGERALFGDTLVTLNQHGGLEIERVILQAVSA